MRIFLETLFSIFVALSVFFGLCSLRSLIIRRWEEEKMENQEGETDEYTNTH